jgi:hypothetical protein
MIGNKSFTMTQEKILEGNILIAEAVTATAMCSADKLAQNLI